MFTEKYVAVASMQQHHIHIDINLQS